MGIDVNWIPSCLKLNWILEVYLMNFIVMGINVVNFVTAGFLCHFANILIVLANAH